MFHPKRRHKTARQECILIRPLLRESELSSLQVSSALVIQKLFKLSVKHKCNAVFNVEVDMKFTVQYAELHFA